MTTERLIFYILCGMQGDTVAKQFQAVYENDESFDQQNENALKYILSSLTHLKDVPALESIKGEIEYFESEIEDYLNKN